MESMKAAKVMESKRVVIVHPEMGIFVGHCLGLGFWTKLDPAGQDAAACFESEQVAEEHMATWDSGRPEGVTFVEVIPDRDDGRCASIVACVRAGLPAWLVENTPTANTLPA